MFMVGQILYSGWFNGFLMDSSCEAPSHREFAHKPQHSSLEEMLALLWDSVLQSGLPSNPQSTSPHLRSRTFMCNGLPRLKIPRASSTINLTIGATKPSS